MMTNNESEYWRILKVMDDGNLSEAASRFVALIAGATDARFHATCGICLQKLGRWSESIPQFEAAIALKPAYSEADWRNMLAQSYLQDGQKHRAIDQWRIVGGMDPSYPSRDFPIDEAKRMLEAYSNGSDE
jgi:tetratricopeptide (TPR) repeat protein